MVQQCGGSSTYILKTSKKGPISNNEKERKETKPRNSTMEASEIIITDDRM